MTFQPIRRLTGLALALSACLALTGCLFMPGKFTSQMELNRDGTFSYSYEGELVFLMLTDAMQQMAVKDDDEAGEFTAYCWNEKTGAERRCTVAEIEEQRAEMENLRSASAESQAREAEEMQRMLGFDPSRPEAGEELARKLERQEGWDSVTYRGDGIFDVRYEVRGRLDYDFAFPMIEGMTGMPPFVVAYRRDDGQVRIGAPGFVAGGTGDAGAAGSSFGLMAIGMMGSQSNELSEVSSIFIDGDFSVVTDGEILANNTDEGASRLAGGKRSLAWTLNAQSTSAPTALIGLR